MSFCYSVIAGKGDSYGDGDGDGVFLRVSATSDERVVIASSGSKCKLPLCCHIHAQISRSALSRVGMGFF